LLVFHITYTHCRFVCFSPLNYFSRLFFQFNFYYLSFFLYFPSPSVITRRSWNHLFSVLIFQKPLHSSFRTKIIKFLIDSRISKFFLEISSSFVLTDLTLKITSFKSNKSDKLFNCLHLIFSLSKDFSPSREETVYFKYLNARQYMMVNFFKIFSTTQSHCQNQ